MTAIKVIDYKAGNAQSVMHAIDHLGFEANFARSPADLSGATHIILPGVGSARATMESLAEMGIVNALKEAVLSQKKTLFLGICVGMQILFEHSEEGDAGCLGWLKGRVVKFDASRVRVPQMGWNKVTFAKDTMGGIDEDCFYFVNSYYACPVNESDSWGTSDYGGLFTAAVHRDNIFATQFHAEKSGGAGLGLLRRFLESRIGDQGVC